MRKTLFIMLWTFAFLIVADAAIEMFIRYARASSSFLPVVRYFDYGRSVPGKLTQWYENPSSIGNLSKVAWRPDILAKSKSKFDKEIPSDGPVIRGYSMSFVNHVIKSAQKLDPTLIVDLHAGPGAPPNFTYELFLADRHNRRAGDVVVWGILASSLGGMAALSNQTWTFEQPAPMTYPIFLPDKDGLRKIEPIVYDYEDSLNVTLQKNAKSRWYKQLEKYDRFYSPITYGLTSVDNSPFARQVRRSFAKRYIKKRKSELLGAGEAEPIFPYASVLIEMAENFAQTARNDGQVPVVVLIQPRGPEPDILRILKPILTRLNIPYVASIEWQSPNDPKGFVPDGHFNDRVNHKLGLAFLKAMHK